MGSALAWGWAVAGWCWAYWNARQLRLERQAHRETKRKLMEATPIRIGGAAGDGRKETLMGYPVPRRDHIVEDVARMRRERGLWMAFTFVPLGLAVLIMLIAMMAKMLGLT